MKFNNFNLSKSLEDGLEMMGFVDATPIQQQAIPIILNGDDLIACAQTGTGKTAAFVLPILSLLSSQKQNNKVRALIIAPTRELAKQIDMQIEGFSYFTNSSSYPIYGGGTGPEFENQKQALVKGTDIIICTPGRLMAHLKFDYFDTKHIDYLILDEADRMLDMGFKRDLDKIMSIIPRQRQNLLFSATFSKEIKVLARQILNNPEIVEATPENTTVEAIVQKAYRVDKNKKAALIIKLILEGGWFQVLVFTRTKHGANNLCKKMIKSNIKAAAIHGNKSQSARTKALSGFKSGEVEVLVATDIAARGLDIPLLPHVINFELPNISEDYVHRIGRTGRAGAKGEALSLVSVEEKNYLRDIEKLIGNRIQISTVEGFEPDPNYVPAEKTQRSRVKHKSRNPNKGFPRRGSRR